MFGNILRNAAKTHEKLHTALIDSSERELFINIPREKVATGGASMFADLATTPAKPDRYGPCKCLWYDSTAAFTSTNQLPFQLTGTYPDMKVIAVVKLKDILLDPSDPYGETALDKAQTVVSAGHLYNVLGFERDGMATGFPYIATVALSGEVNRVET